MWQLLGMLTEGQGRNWNPCLSGAAAARAQGGSGPAHPSACWKWAPAVLATGERRGLMAAQVVRCRRGLLGQRQRLQRLLLLPLAWQ